ncbi:MAG TPA: efflux RND transporter periplasmic adaptor subunit [Fimbriiglobus sp.]|nr:efflux RND transporter periplasmic adaptor subunit [Fimbriiglobus sp.]
MSEPVRTDERRGLSLVGHVVRRGIPVVVLLGLLVGAYLFWRDMDHAPRHEAAPQPQQPIPVSVLTVRQETVPVRMRFLGQTEGAQVVEIRARVAGYLLPRKFEEGKRVEKGQKLFQIDPRPFEVDVAQAKARLASADASLLKARQQLKRFETATVARLELDNARAEERVASADVGQQTAQLAAAELQLGYTSIEAPITGVIGKASKDTGSYVDAGQNGLLAVIQQIDPMYVRYSVTEQEILRFQRQTTAKQIVAPPLDQIELEITLSDGSTYPHKGRINFIDVQVDVTTGTSVVRGQVPNPDDKLKPGQFIYASVLGIQRVDVVRVPQSVVSQSPTGASVMVVSEKNVAEVRPVVLGEWSGNDHWIVEQGLKPGDRVITDRLMMIRPGAPVTPVTAPSAEGQPTPKADDRPSAATGK